MKKGRGDGTQGKDRGEGKVEGEGGNDVRGSC